MEIQNPRRIFLVSPPNTDIAKFLQSLINPKPTNRSGSEKTKAPAETTGSLVGTTHILPLRTAYYTADISIWIDEIPTTTSPRPSSSAGLTRQPPAAAEEEENGVPARDIPATEDPSLREDVEEEGSGDRGGDWLSAFLSPEAAEVRAAIGAYILVFRDPVDKTDFDMIRTALSSLKQIIAKTTADFQESGGLGGEWDGVCLAVRLPQSVTPVLAVAEEEWEDLGMESGFEVLQCDPAAPITTSTSTKGMRNEFGELTGLPRILEALSANDWGNDNEVPAGAANNGMDFLDGVNGGEESDQRGFGIEAAQMQGEMAGLRSLISGREGEREDGNEEEQVEEMEGLMRRLVAAKEMSEGMPDPERKRFAKKTVESIVKTL